MFRIYTLLCKKTKPFLPHGKWKHAALLFLVSAVVSCGKRPGDVDSPASHSGKHAIQVYPNPEMDPKP